MTRPECIEISQRAFALSMAAHLYDQVLQEEQRVLREINRLKERLAGIHRDKQFYGKIIGQ